MGPKRNINMIGVAARERKEEAQQKANSKIAKDAEDAEWAAAGEGAKSKAQAKKEEQNKQREEAAAKKAEAKRLAAEEEATLAASAIKAPKAKTPAQKVTLHQRWQRLDAELKDLRAGDLEREKEAAVKYRDRTREAALEALNMSQAEDDRHPEKRVKALFEAFQERELPGLKEDKPGLKQSQYKDILWKAWQEAPEIPFNKLKQ